MTLNAGVFHSYGVIVGTYGNRPIEGRGLAVIAQVQLALLAHHNLNLFLDHASYAESGFLQLNKSSSPAVSAARGTLLRVANGAGYLSINGARIADMDYGDWAYIPPGLTYTMTGTIVSGMNLRYVTATVEESR